jgi:uncharacterized delta-60 repeat protein
MSPVSPSTTSRGSSTAAPARAQHLGATPRRFVSARLLAAGTLALALALPVARPAVATPGISLGLTDGSGLAVDPTGRVVVSGPGSGDDAQLELARRLPQGAADNTLGPGGLLPVGLPEPSRASVALDTVTADGALLLAGHYTTAVHTDAEGEQDEAWDAAVVRLRPDGHPDNAFGSAGIVTLRPPSANGDANAVSLAVQGDGSILVLGWAGRATFVARLNPDGTPDPTFGNAGVRLLRVAHASTRDDHPGKLLVARNGRIVIALSTDVAGQIGEGFDTRNDDFALVGLHANGSIDRAFGHNGVVVTPVGGERRPRYGTDLDFLENAAIDRRGRIVAFGTSNFDGERSPAAFAAVRYHPDGRLDRAFGRAGRVLVRFRHADARAVAGAITADGRIWIVGYTGEPGHDNTAIARLRPNGSPDTLGPRGIRVMAIDPQRVDLPRSAVASGRDFLITVMIDTRRNDTLYGGDLRLIRLRAR